MTGLFATDCQDPAVAWISWADPGCLIGRVGGSVGTAADAAVSPLIHTVEIAFAIVAVAVIIIVLILAFAPNIRHIVPVFR